MKKEDRALAWEIIEKRVVEKIEGLSGADYRGQKISDGPAFFLKDLFEKEIPRLEKLKRPQKAYLDTLKGLRQSDDLSAAVSVITKIYLKEITGRLNPFWFNLISSIGPKLFSLVFVRKNIWKIMRNAIFQVSIKPFFRLSGNDELIQELSRKGTLIVAPTHSSNLDSPLLGLGFHKMGLPPLIYGAGINLFEYKFFAFFMNQLGAFKVDRLKTNELYKLVLKEYCTYSLEIGYHNLFFPGGTRARSGEIESKLKTGLLSCGIEAYCNNVAKKQSDKKIFIVPCTINYHSVLEAPTLIEDHLKREGQKRFIISDDESSRPNDIFYFLRSSSKFYLHIGQPTDPFGNRVNENGESIDSSGNVIDIEAVAKSVTNDNENYQWTKKSAREIVASYKRNNVILNTHVVARVLYQEVRQRYPDRDVTELTFLEENRESVDLSVLYDKVEILVDQLRKLHQSGEIICSEDILTRNITGVLQEGLEILTHFHWPSAIRKHGHNLIISNFKLLLFYQNKINGHDI
ncbi:MAG: hypothetical protein HOE90_00065 [Bacteriovoracaceae bacterium]|jgi:glycerol-3-phosphate O-acyltransferase|nr:hypothetical protein [Bacteriovoracaceae bacterium]